MITQTTGETFYNFPLSQALAKPLRFAKIGLGLFGMQQLALQLTLTEQGAAVDFFAYFFHLQEKSLSAKRQNQMNNSRKLMFKL